MDPDFLKALPAFNPGTPAQYRNPQMPTQPDAPEQGSGYLQAIPAGFYGGLGSSAAGVASAARAVGAPGAAQAIDEFAARQQKTAESYTDPTLNNLPWYDPRGIAYQTLKGLPMMAGAGAAALGAGSLATGLPEAVAGGLGAAAALYPSMVGENVQRARSEGQPVNDAMALGLGVPEALVAGALPAFGERALVGGVERGVAKTITRQTEKGVETATVQPPGLASRIAKGAAIGAGIQGGASAAGEALMQQMGDPNRPLAARAQDVLNAALAGAGQGAAFGGVIHGLAKKPAPKVTNDDLIAGVEGGLQGGQVVPSGGSRDPTTPPPPPPGTGVEPVGPGPGFGPEPPQLEGQRKLPPPDVPEGEFREVGPQAQIGDDGRPSLTPPDPNRAGALEAPQNIRIEPQLKPQPFQPPEGPIEMGTTAKPPLVGEPVEPPQTPRLPAPELRAARDERVARPASDNDPLVTPPVSGDPASMSGADLISAASKLTGNETMASPIMQEIRARVKDLPVKSGAEIKQALLDQDTQKAKAAVATSNAAIIKAQVDPQTQRLPTFLKDPAKLGDTLALKSEIYERFKSAKTPPTPRTALFKAAKAFGVLDQDENLVDPRAQVEQDQTPPPVDPTSIPEGDPVANHVPSRPTLHVDAPAGVKTHWTQAETLRGNLPDSLKNDLGPELDKAQSLLASNKRDEMGTARGIIAKVKTAIEGAKAADALKGRETTKTPLVVDDLKGAKKFDTPPVDPNASKQDQMRAKQSTAKASEPIPGTITPQDRLKATQANNRVLDKLSKAKTPAEVTEAMKGFQSTIGLDPDALKGFWAKAQEIRAKRGMPPLELGENGIPTAAEMARMDASRAARRAARDAPDNVPAQAPVAAPKPPAEPKVPPKAIGGIAEPLKDLRKTIQQLGNEKVAPNPPKTVKGQPVPETEKNIAKRQKAYDDAVGKLADQHDALLAAAKAGDVAKLKKIEDGFFGTDLSDLVTEGGHGPNPKIEALVAASEQQTEKVLDAVKEATNQKGLNPRVGAPFASTVPSDRDVALTQKVADGGSLRDLLQDTVANGSTSMRKSLAARLLQTKIDSSIRFGTQEEAQTEHPTLRNVYGDYHRDFDRVRIYDQADMEHTILHEAVHAATIDGLKDPTLRAKVSSLMDAVKSRLTPDEKTHPSLSNPEEFIAEGMSNPDWQRTLDGMRPDGSKQTLWDRFKNMVSSFLGLPKGSESMLDHVMHLGGEAMDLTDRARSDQAGSAPGLQETTGLYARAANDTADKLIRLATTPSLLKSGRTWLYEKTLGWRALDAIAQGIRDVVPGFQRYVDAVTKRSLFQDKVNAPGLAVSLARQALPKEGQALTDKLKTFTVLGIDPRKSADDHLHLKNQGNWGELQKDIRDANNTYNELKRKGWNKPYDDEIAVNEMHSAMRSVGLGREMLSTPTYRDRVSLSLDPEEMYRNDTSGMHNSPTRAAGFWKGQEGRMLGEMDHYVTRAEAAIAKELDPKKQQMLREHIEDMKNFVADTKRTIVERSQSPNFAVRRQGGFFAHATMVANFTEAQVKTFQQALNKAGFKDVVLQHNNENGKVYIRTDEQYQAEKLLDVFRQMREQGVIDKNEEISAGSGAKFIKDAGITPTWMSKIIDNLGSHFPDLPDGMNATDKAAITAAREAAKAQMVRQYMDMLPDSSMSKLYATREGVQGFSANMGLAGDNRLMNSARALGTLYHRNEIGRSQNDMHENVRALNVSEDPNHDLGVRTRAAAAVGEAMLREAQRNIAVPHNMFDGIRHLTHIAELGFAPAYTASLATQIYTLGLPELAKGHGYLASAAALTKNMPKALALMKAAYSGADKNHFIMTPEKLKAAGFNQKDIDFILTQNNMGSFNLASYTPAVFENTHNMNPYYHALHDYTGAFTLYSEMFPRLTTALAARDLYESKAVPNTRDYNDLHSFVANRVNNSQLSWNGDLNPRNTGKHGVFGGASPIMAQLQGYHMKIMEKLVREVADSFKARGPEEAAGARRFMLGHLAAMTAAAGTMGLPGVNMAAGIYDRLKDWTTGDDTHDIRASYRQYLADTFGNGMGEALAHGVPRLGGFDLSKIGEDRVLPFSDIVASKQKWEDASADWAKQMMGPAYKIGSNLMLAMRDIHNGDYLEALTKAGPEFVQSPAEAYKLSQYGFVDKSGFKFGGDPTTSDVVQKLMGFTPPDEANYEEKNRVVQGLNERGQMDKSTIMEHLARGFNRQDPEEYAAWQQKSQEYAQNHPGELPPMAEFGNYLQEHMRTAAVAGATGLPLNAKLRDLTARGMVSYGNANE